MADKPKRKLKTDDKPKKKGGDAPAAAIIAGVVAVAVVVVTLFLVAGVEEYSEVVVITEGAVMEVVPTGESASARPPYDRGVAYLSEGRFLAAADAFTAAIEDDPDNAEARYGRARAYHGVGEFEVALADYNRLLSDHPDYDWAAWLALADLYWEQYQRTDDPVHLPDALAAVEEAITRMERGENPQPEAYRLAGTVQDALGNPEAALRHYQDYLESAPVPSPVVAARVAELERE
jgi:tetratricopeptide (TPR) repeat protein